MKRWPQWALLAATVLPLVGGLLFHAHGRLNRSPVGEATSLVLEAGPMNSAVVARMTAKGQIAKEVIAGRLSLLQAAAAFRNLDQRWPRVTMPSPYSPKAASDEEVYCLLVMGYVRAEAPEQAADLENRLQAELAAMLRDGTMHLPDAEDANPISK